MSGFILRHLKHLELYVRFAVFARYLKIDILYTREYDWTVFSEILDVENIQLLRSVRYFSIGFFGISFKFNFT